MEVAAVSGFSALGVADGFSRTLTALGYTEPTPIQAQAIPPLLAGRDMLGQAATGTGKTAAFGLPLLHRIAGHNPAPNQTLALVLTPTRELCMQVATALERYGSSNKTRVVAIYGGQSYEPQLRALKRGVHVVVATPGRALDHLRRGTLDLSAVQMIVLDEADEMLDMGFSEDLEAILQAAPAERQTALFSATMPKRIMAIAQKHLTDPEHVALGRAQSSEETPLVDQTAFVVRRSEKMRALLRVLDAETPPSTIIFCRTREDVDALSSALNEGGHKAEAIHGGLSQAQRDRVMKKFRDRSVDTLIATDVAARGLDIKHVSHVVNYDIPEAAEAYVHRIGRTGRAGRAGTAMLFVEPAQTRRLRDIERLTRQRIRVANLPTTADVQKKKTARLAQELTDVIGKGELDCSAVDALAEKFDMRDIAAAALQLIAGRGPKMATPPAQPEHNERPERAERPERHERQHERHDRHDPEQSRAEMAKLYMSVGREGGVKPGDVFALLTREGKIAGHNVGQIEVFARHTVIAMPAMCMEDVIGSMRRAEFKGQQVKVRPFRP